ncbi:alpha/beta hydrolase [Micromonospora echinofusca]|uniref:Alpha/beta fold hydrolase n=1 Tax=Micromonospora echinofusca TaxID=47858 RepID=A0ABS3VQP6_MICEH|nr:alpha/beta fold hydrolase [Micromonospora echinofusca]MBO4206827.1 alpha/beta fold hydrolase [Micromonospora echinofusca]
MAASLVPVTGAASATPSTRNCTEYTVPVSLAEGQPADYFIRGDLCLPASGTPETVQVLVHGGTYNRTYWDFPYQPQLYSYAQFANRAGYATFNLDQIGTGRSSRPHSSLINFSVLAHGIHDVITALRAGGVGGTAFEKVIYVGHSLGTATGWELAGTYSNDADAIISTGAINGLSATGAGSFVAFPANQDPKFASLNLDDGHLTNIADRPVFYWPATSDATVIQVDTDNRDTFPAPLLLELGTAFSSPLATAPTQSITVPVLSVIGDKDALFCADANDCSDKAALELKEGSFHSNAPSFELAVIPQTGHDLNTHYTAPYSFITMINWAKQHAAP